MGTILVVDDDEHIRAFVRKNCAPLATVVEAADGAQALAAARWSRPEVVVMDLEMPVMDGFEAARLIKADPTLGNPVLVALTGADTQQAVPRARAAGFSYFVRKEGNARAFLDEVTRLVREATRAPEVEPLAEAPEDPVPPPRARRRKAARPRAPGRRVQKC